MDEIELLGRLRDIHLPPPPPLWPPAPGWWLLALLLCGIAVAVAMHLRRSRRLRRAALAEWKRLERAYRADGDAIALATGLSVLLRRVSLAIAPEVAGLAGPEWLAWLDKAAGLRFASSAAGRALLTLPYGGGGAEQAEELLHMARRWLKVRT